MRAGEDDGMAVTYLLLVHRVHQPAGSDYVLHPAVDAKH